MSDNKLREKHYNRFIKFFKADAEGRTKEEQIDILGSAIKVAQEQLDSLNNNK